MQRNALTVHMCDH